MVDKGNYWTRTDDIISANDGVNPSCPECKQEMYAMDDHGRFACGGCGYQNPAAMALESFSRAMFPSAWAGIDERRKGKSGVEDKADEGEG